jgi:hypothetical protein
MQNQQLRNLIEQEENTSANTLKTIQDWRVSEANEEAIQESTKETRARTRIANARALISEKEAALYDHDYGTALKGVEKFLGPTVGAALGIRGLWRMGRNKGPVTSEKSIFNRHGEYIVGNVTTRN